jgi:ubiquinone/menaquinone biosynthesis C-methylase UbiE
MIVMRRLVNWLSTIPSAFDGLRWILEGGYRGHATVLQQELSPLPSAILDVGCGTGALAGYFPASSYLGIDYSPTYVAAAREKHPQYRFAVGDAVQLPVADHSFDGVVISGVLHHMSNETAEKVLGEVARVLNPDGRFVIWEDIPARHTWNLVGHLIHALDVGQYIRNPSEYRGLLERRFVVVSERMMRSGAMDYVVFSCAVR